MRIGAVVGLALAGVLAFGAPESRAKALDAASVNEAQFSPKAKRAEGVDPVVLRAQVLLDRARFSPGLVDGRMGENVEKALAAFKLAHGLQGEARLDQDTWTRLTEGAKDPALVEYMIAPEDVKGPFLDELPAKMEDMVDLKRLGYTSALELLAEKFHTSEALLKQLNPGKAFDRAGTAILVPNVLPAPGKSKEKVARIEVAKAERALRAFDKDGKLLAFYPASVGSSGARTPTA